MIKTIDGIIEAARGGEPGIIAVAAAHDRPVIEAVAEACIEKMKRFDKVYITFDIDALDPGLAGGHCRSCAGGPRGRDRRHAQGAGGGPRRL